MLSFSGCLVLLPLIGPKYRIQSLCMYPLSQVLFWFWVANFMLLSAIGTCDTPEGLAYREGQRTIVMHFLFFLVVPFLNKAWDLIITNSYYISPCGN